MENDLERLDRLTIENRNGIIGLRRRIEAQRFILIGLVRSIERSAGIDPKHFIAELRMLEESWRRMNEPSEMIGEVHLLCESLIPPQPSRLK